MATREDKRLPVEGKEKMNSILSQPDKPGRWYVTWGEYRFYGSVFERDGEMWFQDIPNTSGNPLVIRDDGGKWEVAPDRYEDARP